MNTTYTKFDASRYLDSEEARQEYLAIALEDGDTATIQLVLRDIDKARSARKND